MTFTPFVLEYIRKEIIYMKKENKDKQLENFEPDWLKKAAKTMLQGQKESYGDNDQNELMELINSNDEDQL